VRSGCLPCFVVAAAAAAAVSAALGFTAYFASVVVGVEEGGGRDVEVGVGVEAEPDFFAAIACAFAITDPALAR
jgi:hypothetical protein